MAQGQTSKPTGTPIVFKKGSKTWKATGDLNTRHHMHAFLLAGKKGQKIKIQLKAVGKGGIVPTYHIKFPGGSEFGEKGYDPFTGILTESGNYQITVEVNTMASTGTSGNSLLTITR